VTQLPHQILLLVDYDNMRLSHFEKARKGAAYHMESLPDVDIQMEFIIGIALNALRPRLRARSRFEVRLYGGWIDEDGMYTRSAIFLLSLLHRHRRRIGGHQIVPALAESAISTPSARLIGSMRTQVKRPRQKMVDTLLTVDLVAPRLDPEACIVVLSSDDDFVPGLLSSAHLNQCEVVLVRKKAVYHRPNDHALRWGKVSIIEWENTDYVI